MKVIPVPVEHGKVECIGYVFCRDNSPLLGYVPDCKKIHKDGMNALKNVLFICRRYFFVINRNVQIGH